MFPAAASFAAQSGAYFKWGHAICGGGAREIAGYQTCDAALSAGIADTLADPACPENKSIESQQCGATQGFAKCAFCGDVSVELYCVDKKSGLNSSTRRCTPAEEAQVLKMAGIHKECGATARSTTGDPCDPTSGIMSEIETDYQGTGPFALVLRRYYSSLPYPNVVPIANLGRVWRHSYNAKILALEGGGTGVASAYRPDGKVLDFEKANNGPWTPDADLADKLESLYDNNGNLTGWRYTVSDGDLVENYDASGRLTSIANRAGLVQTLTYNAAGLLAQVSDPFGRTLVFGYDTTYATKERITTITGPSGEIYTYNYDSNNHLSSVQYPDNKVRTYQYNADPASDELLGIVDENSQLFATWTYDDWWRVASSSHAGGAERVTLDFGGGQRTPLQAAVTDSFGVARLYNSTIILGVNYVTSIAGQPCPSCGPASATFNVNNGSPLSTTDWNGNRTNYVYDARRLQTSRKEGLTAGGGNTPATRTVETDWHSTFRLPKEVKEKSADGTLLRMTVMTYDDATGNMLTRTITDTVANKSRTWTYTYNANGQPLTIDGPRIDVSDITTYTYYASNDADPGKRGNIATIRNALNHITQVTEYNAHGQPLTITDPNGLTTTLTYDARMRLKSRIVGGETTTYEYDGVGQLKKVTLPDSSFLFYTYNAAHQLTGIADSMGNSIVYTPDAMGNHTLEQVFSPANVLTRTRSREIDALNRLRKDIGAISQSEITQYDYDNQGNLWKITDPLNHITMNTYDALNRLSSVTDPNSGQINYGYNALDQMTSVKDPRNLITTYAYDALNNLNRLTSPDTGVTQNTYDNAGNLATQLDAKGQMTTYTYDALNRVKTISYATDAGLNVVFGYDQGPNGLGRLTSAADSTGTTSYVYTVHGRLATETRLIGGVPFVTLYGYDSAGRLASMTYPGGRQIVYARDGLGRVNGITTTKNNVTNTLLTGVTYQPFGPEKAYTFGNNQTYTRGFDLDGRIAAYSQPGKTLTLTYDDASLVRKISDNSVTPAIELLYNYDTLDRLNYFNAPAWYVNQTFEYDAVGNRTSQLLGANNYTSTYSATSNRIASTTRPPARAFTFDANGSITNDTVNQFTFDARGRLKQATTAAGSSQYLVNAMGQRVKKSTGGIDTVFHYDSGGRLISETDAQGNVKQEYVYLNDIPVAVLK